MTWAGARGSFTGLIGSSVPITFPTALCQQHPDQETEAARAALRDQSVQNGEQYHPQVFSDRWDRLVGQSGLPPVRFHDGRHGAGSQAFAAGVAPKVIQAMPGHSSLRMTMDTCTSIMPGLEEAAAEASVDLVAKAMEKIRKKKDEEAKDRPDSAEQEAEEDDDGGEPVAA
ncbi:tyrosine-type recombinase/integrase [Streptomyces mirabilis]|uniref:tyrosine-type recombinase/integrase n=1 Tax=Streptomyces mirabilis TaxID=68239 RepID=UPI00364643E3